MLLLATAVVLLISSCDSKKKLVSPMAHVADYQWMTAKMNMDITASGMEFKDVSGSIRMRRDSVVWISASAFLGMESVRTLVTQDSVFLVNRMNQTYLAEPLSTMAQTMQALSLREIQALLLGDGSADHVEVQWGPYIAKIRYSDIQWDEPTNFPIKINKNYERVRP